MKVMVFGTFDHVHPGHESLILQAKERGEVIVVVARDLNVERIKGSRPRQSEHDRMRAIERVFPEVRVVLGDPKDFLAPIRAFKPDLLLLGYDQQLPPGVTERDLKPAKIDRALPYEAQRFKSSLRK